MKLPPLLVFLSSLFFLPPSASWSVTWIADVGSKVDIGVVMGSLSPSEPKCLDISLKITPSVRFRDGPDAKGELFLRRDGYGYGSFRPSEELSGEMTLNWAISRKLSISSTSYVSLIRNGIMIGELDPEVRHFDGGEREMTFKLGYSLHPMIHPYGVIELKGLWAKYEEEEKTIFWNGIVIGVLIHHRFLGDGRLEYRTGELISDNGVGRAGEGLSLSWSGSIKGMVALSSGISTLSTIGGEEWKTMKGEFAIAFRLPMDVYPSASVIGILYLPKTPSGGERYTVAIKVAKRISPALSIASGFFLNTSSWNTDGKKGSFSNVRETISISLSL
jgi:hypothetical protein